MLWLVFSNILCHIKIVYDGIEYSDCVFNFYFVVNYYIKYNIIQLLHILILYKKLPG